VGDRRRRRAVAAGAAADERLMRRALALAARGLGETNPNPVVGCVVARGAHVVGEGWHQRAGGPHAEVLALREAGARARGATLYVTLEPCSHFGRTPPCAPLVTESGVARVVVATPDPNPAVGGRGLALLRRAGVEVTTGVLAAEAARLNARFLRSARLSRPFVLLKAATTLDGRIATASGRSKWITSPAQRRQARWLRRLHDAVLVGVGTALADDPLLLPSPRTRRPFTRVVLDSRLRLPAGSRLARSVSPRTPVLVLACVDDDLRRRALESRGVEVVITAADDAGRVALGPALRVLRDRGLTSVMVEGGSEVLGAFLAARLVDEIAIFRAPLLLGGRRGLPAFGGEDPRQIGEALRVVPVPAEPAFPWPWPPQFEQWRPQPTRGAGGRRMRRSG
jgi:diaminohydroxyphosphoribosylaminopyrimidine deaminase / 5-amino-6-(5-phosphoribosylamino)uracil reductase